MKALDKIDFRKAPYRGIIKEIADETGRAQPTITILAKQGNVEVLRLIAAKVRQRLAERKAIEEDLSEAIAELEEGRA